MAAKKRDCSSGDGNNKKVSPNNRSPKKQQQVPDGKDKKKESSETMEVEPKDNSVANLRDKFDGASTDWKKRIQETNKTGWEVTSLPESSIHWKEVSEAKRKDVEGFLPEDLCTKKKWPLVMKDGWKELKFLYQLDENKTFWK